MMKAKHSIVLVDDEEQILKSLSRELHSNDRTIVYFVDAEEAINHIAINGVDLIVSDYRMPKMNGVDFLSKVKKIQADAMSIILSGNSDLDFLKDAINDAGIYRFISKPWDRLELKTVIDCALEFRDLQLENKKLADEVREKNDYIQKQKEEINSLEMMQPGITKVNWDSDGAILLDEENLQ